MSDEASQAAAGVGTDELLELFADGQGGPIFEELRRRHDRVAQLEGRTALDRAEFAEYLAAKEHLEHALHLLLGVANYSMQYDEAARFADNLRILAAAQLQIARRELEREEPPPDPEYRELLDEAAREARGAVMLMEAQELYIEAEHSQRLLEAPDTAIARYHEAQQRFGELAASGLPYSFEGAVREQMCEYMREVVVGVSRLAASEYRAASNSFERARAAVSKLVDGLQVAEPPREAAEAVGMLALESKDALTYVNALKELADFLSAMHAGNYEDALGSGQSMTRFAAEALAEASNLAVPEPVMDARRAELALMEGWLAWARAENAIDQQQWEECRDQVQAARREWSEASTFSHRSALPNAAAVQAQMGTFEMLLQSTLRRLRSERRRVEEVAEMRRERDEAISRVGPRVDVEKLFSAPGAGIVADTAHVTDSHVEAVTGSTPHLGELARELQRLRAVFAAGARDDREREAVAAVDAAAAAARDGDAAAVSRQLAGAGDQVRKLAQTLHLDAVEEAFRQAGAAA